jgi:branched-chain amino acid transport system ATP-binding protein
MFYKTLGTTMELVTNIFRLGKIMTTMENLMLGRHIHIKTGIWSGATFFRRNSSAAKEEVRHREQVEKIIDLLDLQSARSQFVGGLPYGTQKLIELGRALALEPELLLLDEPLGALDALTRAHLQDWLVSVWHEMEKTILLVTHDVEEALLLAGHVILLSARPACVRNDFAIDIARPRTRSDTSLVLQKEKLLQLIYAEEGND